MARPTRQETQARTREDLLATAAEHFLERGYAAASLDQIAEDAGYSKGAVYSNFRNKDELCFAVLDRIRAERMGEIAATLAAGATLDDVVTAFGVWAERTIGDRRWTLLEIEFSVRSRHNEEIRSRIAAGAEGVRTLIAELIRSLADRYDVTPTMDPGQASAMLLGLGIGLGLQRAISPELSAAALTDAVRTLMRPRR
ncbi:MULTISPECIES: TetR/AcrR family transcriptional regulator [Rhodococcus]|uniref:TetR/AcrR family transcriptional regulator n=1 Tax=Rhodococcus TaxID=1827 RepID=UPI00081A3E0D|nr:MULTISPECIES: TetR/AcrR family transcriptional regulator [Rhodococcus]NCL74069.1 HTH-type transcriptional repressor NemR [Rhodococcus sp. YH1]ANZ27391.1 TetR family transcriptional regulator [Rhodococcus sp. WB1]MDV6295324.1 TetR family transcriptional regulator [Rhodococcus aetherivorans]QIX48252.1 TetR family transcriptional regulator [Rhodococcus sp. DMU1]QRI76665.1 TetR family transcriptional regulator [Rhodococcus aetherivorans]